MQFVVGLKVLHDTSIEHKVVEFVQCRPKSDRAIVLRFCRVALLVNGGNYSTRFGFCFKRELKVEKGSKCCVHGLATVLQKLVVDAIQWARGLVVVEV
jgi:hypothetical protein